MGEYTEDAITSELADFDREFPKNDDGVSRPMVDTKQVNGCFNCWRFYELGELWNRSTRMGVIVGRCTNPDSHSGLVDDHHICGYWGEKGEDDG